MKETIKKFIYKKTENGLVLDSTEEQQIEVPTTEELIKEKEEQLLSIYREIQKLKDQ